MGFIYVVRIYDVGCLNRCSIHERVLRRDTRVQFNFQKRENCHYPNVADRVIIIILMTLYSTDPTSKLLVG